LHLVFTRTLKLNVTLVQPDVYIEQDAETGTTIPAAEQKPGLIKTELDTIQFNKANVALVPHRKTATLSSRLRSHRLTAVVNCSIKIS